MSFLESLFWKAQRKQQRRRECCQAEALGNKSLTQSLLSLAALLSMIRGNSIISMSLGNQNSSGPSEMQNIQTDPRLIQAQYDALRELETRGREGFTARMNWTVLKPSKTQPRKTLFEAAWRYSTEYGCQRHGRKWTRPSSPTSGKPSSNRKRSPSRA